MTSVFEFQNAIDDVIAALVLNYNSSPERADAVRALLDAQRALDDLGARTEFEELPDYPLDDDTGEAEEDEDDDDDVL